MGAGGRAVAPAARDVALMYTAAMRTISAHIRNGVVVPDEVIGLPEGASVTILAELGDGAPDGSADPQDDLLASDGEQDLNDDDTDAGDEAQLFKRLGL